jgi:glycosyltransferase involved in cell wall biosynthesis
MENHPLVSICCITYNHEKFISQAIDGFLMQKTSFPFEILIFDDASTDNTQNIIKKYANDNSYIRTFLQIENQWRKNKYGLTDFLFPMSRGKYIAICEGDDYWTDPYKLQKQVDFLEANLDYVICYHDAKIINESGQIISQSKLPDAYKRDFSSKEMITDSWILTLTICFRNVLKSFPKEFSEVFNGDTFLISLLSFYGKGKYLGNIIEPDVYRQHSGGVWSVISPINKNIENIKTSLIQLSFFSKNKDKEFAKEFIMEKILNNVIFLHSQVEIEKVKYQNILNSTTYKIGKLIIWLPSIFLNFIKRIIEK